MFSIELKFWLEILETSRVRWRGCFFVLFCLFVCLFFSIRSKLAVSLVDQNTHVMAQEDNKSMEVETFAQMEQ